MLSLALVSLLTSMALATPVSNLAEASLKPRCDGTGNCETYLNAAGITRIRFKRGMEPGSADYENRMSKNKVKRDGTYPQTTITLGDATIPWGCDIDPVATLNNVSAICATTGQCIDNAPWSTSVQYITPNPGNTASPPVGDTLTISATGTYPAWMRNGIISALQTAAGAPGAINWDRDQFWSTPPEKKLRRDNIPIPNPITGRCDVATFPSYIGLNVYSSATDLEAFVDVSISLPKPSGGFCASFGSPGVGLAGAIAGAFPEGAPLATVFGLVSAVCSVVG